MANCILESSEVALELLYAKLQNMQNMQTCIKHAKLLKIKIAVKCPCGAFLNFLEG